MNDHSGATEGARERGEGGQRVTPRLQCEGCEGGDSGSGGVIWFGWKISGEGVFFFRDFEKFDYDRTPVAGSAYN